MSAFCWTDWDDYSRLMVRLSIVVVCGLGAAYSWKNFAKPSLRAIPRPLWAFNGTILTFNTALTLSFMARCNETLNTLERTMYGTGLVWAIAGLLLAMRTAERKIIVEIRKIKEREARLRQLVDSSRTSNE
jgi:hypothetical protein